jgi:hypothetical protein
MDAIEFASSVNALLQLRPSKEKVDWKIPNAWVSAIDQNNQRIMFQ